MTLSTDACLAAIEQHSAGFAQATRGNLAAMVPSCPDWSVADLVWHLTTVHWSWATIAEERLSARPADSRRPARPAEDELVDSFETGARRLVAVLRKADQGAACWTWAPAQQDVAFITRHQVQEAAVHHWDAANAGGMTVTIAPDVAADAVEEFLTFSVPSEADPDEPPTAPLDGLFALHATDIDAAWTVTDGRAPGTVRVESGAADGAPAIRAPASDLLLWLYKRVQVDAGDVPADLLARFRDLCFTD